MDLLYIFYQIIDTWTVHDPDIASCVYMQFNRGRKVI